MYNRMDYLFNSQIAGISEDYTSLYNLNKILNYKSITASEKIDECEENLEVSIKNVNFKYPNSERYVLSNISIDINPGEIIAIVGENGCGKTTLTKVITGLYEPPEGEIFYNGKSFNELNMKSIYKKIAIVFQSLSSMQ